MKSFRATHLSAAIGLGLAALLTGTGLHAESAPSPYGPQTTQLDTVVVSASGYEQLTIDAPASVSVITHQELERQPFTNLQDALGDVPGVSVTGSDANRKDISIRGMPGKYTLILVDGMRQSTRGNSHRQVTGAAQSAQIPPLQAIKRIEVVRGPMSSLYGSDAIGGVINIITRKPTDHWTGAFDLHAIAQQHSSLGNSRGGDFYLAGPVVSDVVGFQVWGKVNDRTESQVIDGAYATRDEGGTARLTVTPDEHQQWLFEAGTHTLEQDSTQGQTHLRPAGDMHLEFERTHYSLRHVGNWSFGSSEISVYREVGKTHHNLDGAPSRFYPVNQIANTIVDGKLTLPLDRNMLTVGAQYMRNDLDGTNNEGNNTIRGMDNTSWALFAEDEYRPIDDLAVTGGIRYNHDERYGSAWTPRLYAVYHLSDRWVLRGGIARGFRAPGLRQTSPQYVAVTGVGHIGVPRGKLPGNPDLEPETSTSSEIGLQYVGANGLQAGITIFNDEFRNKIFSECVERCSGASGALYAWGNIGKARNRGAELNLTWPFADAFTLHANYTHIQSERLSDDEYAFNGESLRGQPLARTPEDAVDVRLAWQPIDKWSTWLALHSSSPQYWANFRNGAQWVRKRPGSTTYDLGVSYTFSDHLNIRAALLNLTDKRVPVDRRNRLTGLDGNWMVDNGRRLWVSVGLGF
ncbi:MAG TPA: TonB-dependent receptor [Oleiagrimonas sp.]|nr:TonB-dependent receptor [Oleiagrimonas sp.]